jgi:hypothetical protein
MANLVTQQTKYVKHVKLNEIVPAADQKEYNAFFRDVAKELSCQKARNTVIQTCQCLSDRIFIQRSLQKLS